MIFEEVRNHFSLFKNPKMRNMSINNLSIPHKNKFQVQKNEQIQISISSCPKDQNNKTYSKNHDKFNANERIKSGFNRITEENEDPSISRRNSSDNNYISKLLIF